MSRTIPESYEDLLLKDLSLKNAAEKCETLRQYYCADAWCEDDAKAKAETVIQEGLSRLKLRETEFFVWVQGKKFVVSMEVGIVNFEKTFNPRYFKRWLEDIGIPYPNLPAGKTRAYWMKSEIPSEGFSWMTW